MKKVLFATTALVFTAGAAAAEVTVGGDGRMGILYTEGAGFAAAGSDTEQARAQSAVDALNTRLTDIQQAVDDEVDQDSDGDFDADDLADLLTAQSATEDALAAAQSEFDIVAGSAGGEEFSFTSRIRISFTATGETDNGLQFGGSIRADNSSAGTTGTAGNVFVSGAFGKLSAGDVDSGAKAAVGQVSGVGLTGLGDFNEITYLSTPVDPSALYEYSFGAASLYASLDQFGDDDTAASVGLAVGLDDYGLAGVAFAVGYEYQESQGDHYVVGFDAGFGDFTLKGRYGNFNGDDGVNDFEQYAVSADYTFGATTVTAFYKDQDIDFGDDFELSDFEDGNYGIGASYDLGGGAALKGGVVHNGGTSSANDVRADFGISMSF